MADFKSFSEGRKELASSGLPATCHFLLSTKAVDTHAVGDTLAGGVGEITGTGYARQTEAEPTPSLANPTVISFAVKTWATGAATDWPAAVRSVVMATSADNSGKAIAAWNLIAGGAARDLSQASTTENFTPTLTLA